MSTSKVIFNPLLGSGFQKISTTAETIADVTTEPSGFEDPSAITSDYSITNRIVTLSHASGFIVMWIKGVRYSFASPWTVPTVIDGSTPIAHANATGAYHLVINKSTLAIRFDTTAYNQATESIISLAAQGPTYQLGIRETHGLMQWQCHDEFHWVAGGYLRSAPVATNYAVLSGPTATNAANTPGIDTLNFYDEDLRSVIAAWPEGTYTTVYRNGLGGAWTFSTVATTPFLVGGSTFIQYNRNLAGTWSLQDVPEDSYVNILLVVVPVANDADSQKFRFVWVTGQTTYTTSAAALAATSLNLDFTGLNEILSEYLPIMQFTYQKASAGGNATGAGITGRCWLAAEPTKFFGTARNVISQGGTAATDHQALSNRTSLDAHPVGAISAVSADKIVVTVADGAGGFKLSEDGTASDIAFKSGANTFSTTNTFNGATNMNGTVTIKAGSDASKASSIVPATDSDMSVGAGWSGTNWTIGGGVYTHVAGANNATLSSVAPLASTMYEVGIKVTTTTAGSLTVSLGGTVAIQNLGAFTTLSALTFYISILTVSTANLVLIPDANWVGTVDDVTIKLVTAGATNNINRNSTSSAGVEIRECVAVSSEGVGFRNQRYSTGGGNTSLGYDSMYKNTIGTQNVALGYKALSEAANCNNTVAIGYQACMNAATVDRSVAIGTNAMMNCVGTRAPFSYGSVAIGYEALLSHPYVQDNVALGYKAGRALVKGQDNMLIGSNSAINMTDGSFNVMIGTNAGFSLTGAATISNIFIGSNAGYSVTAGSYNTAIGQDTFRSVTASTSRTINLGYSAGYYNDVSGAFLLDSYFRSSKTGEIRNSLFYGILNQGYQNNSGKSLQTLRINAAQWIAGQTSIASTQEIKIISSNSIAYDGVTPATIVTPVESTNAYSSIRWTSTAAHKQKYDLFMNTVATDTAPVSVHAVSDTGAHTFGVASGTVTHQANGSLAIVNNTSSHQLSLERTGSSAAKVYLGCYDTAGLVFGTTAGGAEIGAASLAGAWTLGAAGNVTVDQQMNGKRLLLGAAAGGVHTDNTSVETFLTNTFYPADTYTARAILTKNWKVADYAGIGVKTSGALGVVVFGSYDSNGINVNNLGQFDSSGNWTFGNIDTTGSHIIYGSISFGRNTAGGTVSISGNMIQDAAGSYAMKWNQTTGVVSYTTSARQHKEEIIECPYGLNTVLQLKPKKYVRKSTKETEIGLIADEVYPLIPEASPLCKPEFFGLEGTDLMPAGVHYEMITPVLVKSIQELNAKIEALQEQLNGTK